MNKNEFYNRLMARFSTTFKDEKKGDVLLEDYDRVLTGKIDFDKLYEYVNTEYDKTSAPVPAWFIPYVRQCRLQSTDKTLYLNIWRRYGGVEYPYRCTHEDMEKIRAEKWDYWIDGDWHEEA